MALLSLPSSCLCATPFLASKEGFDDKDEGKVDEDEDEDEEEEEEEEEEESALCASL